MRSSETRQPLRSAAAIGAPSKNSGRGSTRRSNAATAAERTATIATKKASSRTSELEVDERVRDIERRDRDCGERGQRPDPEHSPARQVPLPLLARRPHQDCGDEDIEEQMTGNVAPAARAAHCHEHVESVAERLHPEEDPTERHEQERERNRSAAAEPLPR